MSTAEFRPPKPVQCWQADDYAQKGRFVSDLARPVVDLLAPKRGERILDLGCGGGELTELIAASGADVLGAVKVAPWFFPSIAGYRRPLEQGSFTVKSITLVPRPTTLEWYARIARDPRPLVLRAIRGTRALRGLRRDARSVAGALRCRWRVDRGPHQASLCCGADQVTLGALASPHPCQILGRGHGLQGARRSTRPDAGSEGAGHDATV